MVFASVGVGQQGCILFRLQRQSRRFLYADLVQFVERVLRQVIEPRCPIEKSFDDVVVDFERERIGAEDPTVTPLVESYRRDGAQFGEAMRVRPRKQALLTIRSSLQQPAVFIGGLGRILALAAFLEVEIDGDFGCDVGQRNRLLAVLSRSCLSQSFGPVGGLG